MKLESFNLNLFNKDRIVEIDIGKKETNERKGTGNFTSATAKTEIAEN